MICECPKCQEFQPKREVCDHACHEDHDRRWCSLCRPKHMAVDPAGKCDGCGLTLFDHNTYTHMNCKPVDGVEKKIQEILDGIMKSISGHFGGNPYEYDVPKALRELVKIVRGR